MTDLDKAREWAEDGKDIYDPSSRPKAVIDIILSLPDQWVDAEKVRELVSTFHSKEDVPFTPFVAVMAFKECAEALESLLTPKLPTLADMSEEEREACQWMQADVKLSGEGSVTCVIADPRNPGAKVRVWAPHGGSDDIEAERITPLPDLPKLKWPAQAPRNPETPPAETLNNTSSDTPRNSSGKSNSSDVLENSIEDFNAGRFVDFDLEESDSEQQSNPQVKPESPIKPEDVPDNEMWLVELRGSEWIGRRDREAAPDYPWRVTYLGGIGADIARDSQITLIHKLVPEPPALPEGMRLADHAEYGRVVVSPGINSFSQYLVFRLDGTIYRATDTAVHKEHLNFLDGEPNA